MVCHVKFPICSSPPRQDSPDHGPCNAKGLVLNGHAIVSASAHSHYGMVQIASVSPCWIMLMYFATMTLSSLLASSFPCVV